MEPQYIQAPPLPFQYIIIHNGKRLNIRPAKWNEVPPDYRKKRFKDRISERLLYIISFKEKIKSFFRKGNNK